MWGMTGAAYLRLKEPEYEDGVGTPRKMSRQGSKLPDALAVSSQLMWTHNDPHDFITALAAIWGQFVANDIRYECSICQLVTKIYIVSFQHLLTYTHFALITFSYTLPLSGYEQCCDSMFRKENAMECYPIVANTNEAICQEYVRSAIGLKPGCSLGAREQMNFATAYLDGSGIYGSTPKSSEDLRLLKGGLLKMDSGRVLPLDEHNPNCRLVNGCVRSGDERVNHNAGIAAVHTVFAREHNRVARLLADVNPHWDEETIYQVRRKI